MKEKLLKIFHKYMSYIFSIIADPYHNNIFQHISVLISEAK